MRILVIDIGGTNVKFLVSGETEPRRADSQPDLTPGHLLELVATTCPDWDYDAVSIGYPGEVGPDGPMADPGNLGVGWLDFDYEKAFGKPVRIMNDAAMQALGAYDDKRMLFLGLGTGLGSALVADRVVIPLELGRLKFRGKPIGERLGRESFERDPATWAGEAAEIAEELRDAMMADYIVFGGGNAKSIDPLPPKSRRGGNDDAFAGGFKLWSERVDDQRPASVGWRVVG